MFEIKDKYIYRQCVNDSRLLEQILDNNLEVFYKDKLIKEMLLVSNPIYSHKLTEDTLYSDTTFRNYIKRSVTRATPYGLFSSVGVGTFENSNSFSHSCCGGFSKKISVDGQWISALCMKLEKDNEVLLKLNIQWNQKVFDFNDRYKVLDLNYWGAYKECRDVVINKTPLLEYIQELTYKKEINISKLVLLIQDKIPHFENHKILNYIGQLISNEILFTDLRKIIQSSNFLDDIIKLLSQIELQKTLLDELTEIKLSIEEYCHIELGEGISQYLAICNKMSNIVHIDNQTYLKIDLINTCIHNSFPSCLKGSLEEFVNDIAQLNLNKRYRNYNLKLYVNKFLEKYGEYVEIPIKNLLDSNIGLGFPKLYSEVVTDEVELEQTFLSYLREEMFKSIWSNCCELDIANFLSKIPRKPHSDLFPKQLELYCEVVNNQENQLEVSLVPNTGSDMLGKTIGRFAPYFSSSEIELDSRDEYVELIEFPINNKNINVMSADNNHSKKLLLSYEGRADINYLELDDIVVGITKIEGIYKLYFRDLRTNSIINFVTTSMLNPKSDKVYSKLSRFLLAVSAEWQNNPFILCRILENFDDFPYIPRIKYKNITLIEEKWKMSKNDKQNIFSIKEWRNKFKVPRLIYFHNQDERILIDLDNHLDLKWILKQKEEVLAFTRYNKKTEKSTEFVFGFEDTQNNFKIDIEEKPVRILSNRLSSKYTKTFSSDWCYIILYGINVPLINEIRESLFMFTEQLIRKDLISDFHFLNYVDNEENSLRVRFKVTHKEKSENLRSNIFSWIDDLISYGLCHNASFNIYDREVERYGGLQCVEVCERLFSIDSYLLLKLFKRNVLQIDNPLSILHSIFLYLGVLDVPLVELKKILTKHVTKDNYRKKFRRFFQNNSIVVKEFQDYFDNINKIDYQDVLNEVQTVFPIFAKQSLDSLVTTDVVYSLIHMHMNRMGIYASKEKEYLYFIKFIVEILDDYKTYFKKI